MKRKTINLLKWIGSVFFLLSALIYLPSVASIFMGVLGLFLLPIHPLQNFIKKLIKAKWIRIVIAIALFFIAMLLVPAAPDDPNQNLPLDPTGSSITETTDNISDEPTASTSESITQTTTEATTEATTAPTTEATTPPIVTPPQNSSFSIHFIDVGQADAALVECDGHYMLIDGGNKADSNVIYSVLKKAGVSKLDIVVGTHAHEDHIGGLPGAYNYCSADLTLCPVKNYDSNAFEDFVKYANQKGSGITVPSVGDTYALGSSSVKILGINGGSDPNNTSIVLRIDYGETSFIFTGDAEREAEQVLLNSGVNLAATVLKVGHHGSDTSTTYPFLREIMPQYAVISVGTGNSYGHPTEDTLSRLRDADVAVFRTDLQGDVFCSSNGQTVTFSVSKNADADVFGNIGNNSTQKPTEPEETQRPNETEDDEPEGTHYVLNTNTKKFHYPNCGSAKKISEKNRQDYYGTREELIAMGYSPCGNCDP